MGTSASCTPTAAQRVRDLGRGAARGNTARGRRRAARHRLLHLRGSRRCRRRHHRGRSAGSCRRDRHRQPGPRAASSRRCSEASPKRSSVTPTGRWSFRTREPEELPCTTNQQSLRTTRPEEGADGLSLGRALADLQGAPSSSPACCATSSRHDRATRARGSKSTRRDTADGRGRGSRSRWGQHHPHHRPPPRTRPARVRRGRGRIDLVLGSSHRGPLGRRLIGGTADVVLSGAPCPVRGRTTPTISAPIRCPLQCSASPMTARRRQGLRSASGCGWRRRPAPRCGWSPSTTTATPRSSSGALPRRLRPFPRRSRARPSSRPAIPSGACSTKARTSSACSWPARAATVRCGASCSEVSRAISCARPACRSS